MMMKSISLRDWQIKAFEQAKKALEEGRNVLIVAPTGAGKSFIAFKFIEEYLKQGKYPIVYTTPLRVLTYQKAGEIRKWLGIKPKIETGEWKESKFQSPIITCTQEIYKDKYQNKAKLVIIDEFHAISDYPDRAINYLETLKNHPIISLSATIKITPKFIRYLEKVSGRKWEIIEYQNSQGNIVEIEEIPIYGAYHIGEIVENSKYITAVISFSRKRTEMLASSIYSILPELDKEIIERIELESGKTINELKKIFALKYIDKGIAIIHSKVPTFVKRLIIRLAEKNLIRVIIGTDSFTLGTNFPIENIIFDQLQKFDGQKYRWLTEKEFIQIVGRAGRNINGTQIIGKVYRFEQIPRFEDEYQEKWKEYIQIYKEKAIRELEIQIKIHPKEIFETIAFNKDINELIQRYEELAKKYAYPELDEEEIRMHKRNIKDVWYILKDEIVDRFTIEELELIKDMIIPELWGTTDSIRYEYIVDNKLPNIVELLRQLRKYGYIKYPEEFSVYSSTNIEDISRQTQNIITVIRQNIQILNNRKWIELKNIDVNEIIESMEKLIQKLEKIDKITAEYWKEKLERIKIKNKQKEQIHS